MFVFISSDFDQRTEEQEETNLIIITLFPFIIAVLNQFHHFTVRCHYWARGVIAFVFMSFFQTTCPMLKDYLAMLATFTLLLPIVSSWNLCVKKNCDFLIFLFNALIIILLTAGMVIEFFVCTVLRP